MEVRGVFIVDPDAALAVDDREFRLAAERNRANNGTVGGVNGGGVLAATVECKDALAGGVVNDGVRIGVGLRGADGFQSLEIKNGDGVGAAVAGEAAAEIGS